MNAPANTPRRVQVPGLEQYVAATVAGFPPLTDEQLHQVAALLAPAGGGRK